MTQAQHTKGPWEDNGAGLIYGQVSGDDDEAPFVADCCKDGGSGDYDAEEVANARLIAAAPDLLEALQLLLRYQIDSLIEDGYTPEQLAGMADIVKARETIARAKGETL